MPTSNQTEPQTQATDKLAIYFRDLDEVLAGLSKPEYRAQKIQSCLNHNRLCKKYLCKHGSARYSAFDLTAIEAGLYARLNDVNAAAVSAELARAA